MSTAALLFMVVVWTMVLGLAGWSFGKILRGPAVNGARTGDAGAAGRPESQP